MLEEHANQNLLDNRFIDRLGYPKPNELIKKLNEPFEEEQKVALSAVATGQTEGNFELEKNKIAEEYEYEKIEALRGLSNEDPY